MGYHWIGGENHIKTFNEIDTPQKCQQLCSAEDKCNWFSWRDTSSPTGCFLLENKGTTKSYDYGRTEGANGPKNCIGKYIQYFLKNSAISVNYIPSHSVVYSITFVFQTQLLLQRHKPQQPRQKVEYYI